MGLLRRYLDKCYMRSRSNQSAAKGWLCAERFLRILLWPWCGPLSISNKIFSIGIKTINHTPSTSFTRRRDGCVCQKLVRASCSRLMCLPIRPCQPLRSWQSSLIRNPWPRLFLQLTSLPDRLLHGQARRSSLRFDLSIVRCCKPSQCLTPHSSHMAI